MQSVLGHRSEVLWWVDPTMSTEERPKLRCSGLHLESRGPNFSYKQGHDRIPIWSWRPLLCRSWFHRYVRSKRRLTATAKLGEGTHAGTECCWWHSRRTPPRCRWIHARWSRSKLKNDQFSGCLWELESALKAMVWGHVHHNSKNNNNNDNNHKKKKE